MGRQEVSGRRRALGAKALPAVDVSTGSHWQTQGSGRRSSLPQKDRRVHEVDQRDRKHAQQHAEQVIDARAHGLMVIEHGQLGDIGGGRRGDREEGDAKDGRKLRMARKEPVEPRRGEVDLKGEDDHARLGHIQDQPGELPAEPLLQEPRAHRHETDRRDDHHGSQLAHQHQTHIHIVNPFLPLLPAVFPAPVT